MFGKSNPYAYASEAILKQLESLVKEGDTVIQSGDFFHTYKPFPNEYTMATYWLSLIAKKGGRDGGKTMPTNTITFRSLMLFNPWNPLPGLTVLASRLEIEGLLSFLPWVPRSARMWFDSGGVCPRGRGIRFTKKGLPRFVMYHLDETVFMGKIMGWDLRFLENKFPKIKTGGHIHLQERTTLVLPPDQSRREVSGRRYYTLKAGGASRETLPLC